MSNNAKIISNKIYVIYAKNNWKKEKIAGLIIM